MRKKVKEIVNGWKNTLVKDDQVERIAEERRKICDACPAKTVMLGVDCCSICHCPLTAKVRSLDSKCPEGKW